MSRLGNPLEAFKDAAGNVTVEHYGIKITIRPNGDVDIQKRPEERREEARRKKA